MDPFVESLKWETAHHAMAEMIAEYLSPQLPDGFAVSSEDSVSMLNPQDGGGFTAGRRRVPDDYVSKTFRDTRSTVVTVPDAVLAPDSIMEDETAPLFSVLVFGKEGEIVTWIELMSPGNKSEAGLRQYMIKRERMLSSSAVVLEIDLTHGNGRLPNVDPGIRTRYYALLNKPDDRSRFLQYGIPLTKPMRTLKVPVTNATVDLDLQEVFNRVYARRELQKVLDYNDIKKCELPPAEEAWAHHCIADWRDAGNRDMPLRQPRL